MANRFYFYFREKLLQMKITRNLTIVVVLGLFIFSSAVLYELKHRADYQQNLQQEVISELKKLSNCNSVEIPLASIVTTSILEVCVQPPYTSQEDFRKISGKDLKNYEMIIHDGTIRWWLIQSDGTMVQIDISGIDLVAESNEKLAGCVLTQKTNIVFECKSNKIYYNFKS